MSASEADFSDSNLESPFSQSESPYSSPSQQVPQLANFISELSCQDTMQQRGNTPYLRIVEQPQNHFRFRYKSEMCGTHGCLLGKSTVSSKSKSHPAVELKNYTGKALIRCRLVWHDKDEEHPHRLLEDDQDRDVTSVLPQNGIYRVAFSGMGIIHTAKKDVAGLLFQKYVQERNMQVNENQVRLLCESEAKNINLNIVRLKFSAHDFLQSDREICPPVFSEPIHNMKSAATNDLKICRISRCYGRPQGGDDVFLLVEKVNKKNIMIRFFELDENGDRVWNATGTFLQSDVHHQYAIVFRTPQYRDPQPPKDVTVYIELVRPSDGRTSEPKEFIYRAQPYKPNKKRKANYSSYSSLESGSGGSIKSFSDVPVTVENENIHNNNFLQNDQDEVMNEIPTYTIIVPQMEQKAPTSESMMADAMMYDMGLRSGAGAPKLSPMLGAPPLPPAGPPELQLHSSEMDRILARSIEPDERRRFYEADLSEYFKTFDNSLPDLNEDGTPGIMDMLKCSMMADSGRAKNQRHSDDNVLIKEETTKTNLKTNMNIGEYSAVYKSEDGKEVKQLVKELCEIIRNKTAYKKQVVRSKLERLFEMRLCNGDTFLHMTLCSNQPSLEYIVKLIHSMKMTKLLNLKNKQMLTILHLAIINDSPKLVSFLVSKGCNPMEEDAEGNNAFHYAVICQSCVEPLLEAVASSGVACDINAYNNEKQSPLHLAVVYASCASAAALLRHGASLHARDASGRTPLHLAATDDCRHVAALLVDAVAPSDIDALDGRGYTALQIVCDGPMRDNTLEIARLLLEKKADPTRHSEYNSAAWRLARDKPALRALLLRHMDPQLADDVKSEPDDEYESADEGETEGALAELPLYVSELAAALDERGAWRELARRLRGDALLSWYGATPSPTATLLNHLKECDDDITSKSLALVLEDMGCKDAADIIRRYLSD